MASIKGKNTKPELAVRKMLWSRGKRYRIHDRTVLEHPTYLIRERKYRFQIRLANHGDALSFLKLEARCFKMRTNKDTIYFWTPAVCYLWSYKAMLDNKIVGGIIATPTREGDWYVNSLFVHPSYRKHGIATKLLSKIIKTAGNKRIFLDVKTNRKFLIGFYNKHGFKLQKLEKNYYYDGSDRYLLVYAS